MLSSRLLSMAAFIVCSRFLRVGGFLVKARTETPIYGQSAGISDENRFSEYPLLVCPPSVGAHVLPACGPSPTVSATCGASLPVAKRRHAVSFLLGRCPCFSSVMDGVHNSGTWPGPGPELQSR